MAALSNLKAFADGGIDAVDVSAFRGGYLFEVCVVGEKLLSTPDHSG